MKKKGLTLRKFGKERIMFLYSDDNKRYHTLNYFFRNKFHQKVFKVSSNLKYLKFWFDDYMRIQIYTSNQTDKWYYTLELELIY